MYILLYACLCRNVYEKATEHEVATNLIEYVDVAYFKE